MPDLSATQPRIVLASQSPGRRALLQRLCPEFDVLPADIDETPHDGEAPAALAARLAREKASLVAALLPADPSPVLVIGADQVASCSGRLIGKPMNAENNIALLLDCSGNDMTFHSAVYILETATGRALHYTDLTTVSFDLLERERVTRYVQRDKPWFCAGGFKVESSGISLFRAVHCDDPTALIGLPLIFVSAALRELGCTL